MTQSDILEKIANLVLNGVPQVQIAASCGVTESRISQIITTDEYRQVEQVLAVQVAEQQQLLNGGWDAVEEYALGHVLKAMQANPDPEFALKTAAVANRAQRRGNLQSNANQAGKVSTIINLNATFVQQLQENFQIADVRSTRPVSQKRTNMLSVGAVEQALSATPVLDLPQELDFNG